MIEFIKKHRYAAIFAAIIALFNLAYFNRYFPPTDGWWETYGYLLAQGIRPYVDFNLAFPPLFVAFNAILVKLFGADFLLFRGIGVFLTVVNFTLLYLFLARYFSVIVAALTAFFAVIVLMSDPVFIAKDYHMFMELFVAATLLLAAHVSPDRPGETTVYSPRVLIRLALLGFFVGAVSLIKQNVGVFLFIGYAISLMAEKRAQLRSKILSLSSYFLGMGLLLVLTYGSLVYFDIPLPAFLSALFQNNSKGSVWTVLLRFILDKYNLKAMAVAFVLLGAGYFARKAALILLETKPNLLRGRLSECLFELVVAVIAVYSFSSAAIPSLFKVNAISVYVPVTLAVFIVFLYTAATRANVDEHNERMRFIAWPLLMLAYCCTHSSSYNTTGLYFVLAFSAAYLFEHLFVWAPHRKLHFAVVLLSVVPGIMFAKMVEPYSWWGLNQGSVFQARYQLPYPELDGIYADKSTAEFFSVSKSAIEKYSKANNDVYLFPHIPVLYLLSHKLPFTKNLVQWFDVITSENMRAEINAVKARPPELAVIVTPPRRVIAGHEYLLRKYLPQSELADYFDKQTQAGEYRLVANHLLSKNIGAEIWEKDAVRKIKAEIVPDSKYIGRPVKVFLDAFLVKCPDGLVHSRQYKSAKYSYLGYGDPLLQAGDTFSITVANDQVHGLLENIGVVHSTDSYMLKIYAKSGALSRQPPVGL